ncbi:MAG: TOBE domain-containing protein, partial [Haloferacaceae archaeon]|nr:TOBE domain-containing protein [Haloferacaceae archaeon]
EGESTIVAGTLSERDGELATVRTDAGEITAIVPAGAGVVDLHIRAEAVALEETPTSASTTSIMNQLEGVVTAVDRGAQVDRVAVDVGLETPLQAVITRSSTERLGLSEGVGIGVRFKATAVRGLPRDVGAATPDGQ